MSLQVIRSSDIPVVGHPLGLTQLPPAAPPIEASDLTGLIQYPENGSYTVLLNAQESRRIINFALAIAAGSALVGVRIDGVMAKFGLDTAVAATLERKVTNTTLLLNIASRLELVLSGVSNDAEGLAFAFGIEK